MEDSIMTGENDSTVLEREKEALIYDFKQSNPDLFAQYEDIIAFSLAEAPIFVEISVVEDNTNGK
jgi:hypothetical protein